MKLSGLVFLVGCLSAMAGAEPWADVVVASDGTGQYASLQEAISAAPMRTGRDDPRWVILVKRGTYRERIYVQRERGNLLVRREDAATTVVTYDLHAEMKGPDGKFGRTGPGSVDAKRAAWAKPLTAAAAGALTPAAVLGGTDGWNPLAP